MKQNDKVSRGQILNFAQVCHLELMVQCDRGSTSHFYEVICHRLTRTCYFVKQCGSNLTDCFYETVWQRSSRTCHFIEQSGRVLLGQAISVNWKWIWLQFQGEDSSQWESPLRRGAHRHSQYPFRASGYCKAICTIQSGLIQAKESGAVRKEQVFQVMLATLWVWTVKSVPIYARYST